MKEKTFFEYNGKTYPEYTKIKFKKLNSDIIVDGYFTGINYMGYVVMHLEGERKNYVPYTKKQFYDNLISVGEEATDSELGWEYVIPKDSEIPTLIVGWLWFGFVMFVSIIFKQWYLVWLSAPFIFFRWRCKVKKEESYYAKRTIGKRN